MKKIPIRIRVIVAIVLVIIGGIWLRHALRVAEAGMLTLYGNVDIRTAQLAFDDDALVATMRVEEGAQVKAGDVLATLVTTSMKAQLDEAKSQVAAMEAVVHRLEAGTRKQEIEQVRAQLASAEARLANAEQTLKRQTQTAATGASSQQRLDEAQALFAVEQAARDAAKQALALALEGPRSEDLDEGRARLEASRARFRYLEDQLARAELHAPVAGTIQSRLLEPGDYATRGRPAYTLAMTDPKWVRAYVPETSLGKVRQGARAWVTTDSFPGQKIDGWVGYISPVAEFTPKSVETTDLRTKLVYEVRVYVKDPEDRLRMGMPTTVAIDVTSPPTAAPAPER
jgi:HlyD family secretion protein